VLILDGVQAGYGLSHVLDGVSLQVAKGAVVALIGANGAGKTTTMRVASGLLRPTRGQVRLDGQPVQGLGAWRVARLGLAHAPEGRKVFGPLTVEDNLLLGAYRHLPRFLGFRRKARRDLERVFGLFPRLAERKGQLAGTLSGGEQQMLAIGRALLARPTFLMLDEPSMGLAPLVMKEIFEAIARVAREGCTVLLVEQNARSALRIAHRGYVLETGRIVIEGTAEELLASREMQRAYLGRDVNQDPERVST
jgi:branched-chain amino acid transport system ATP-binding protein